MSVDKFGRNSKPLKIKGNSGPPGVGFKLLPSGDFDMEKKRLNNVGMPEEPHQAASKEYVDEQMLLIIDTSNPNNYMNAIIGKYLDERLKNEIVKLIEERKLFSTPYVKTPKK